MTNEQILDAYFRGYQDAQMGRMIDLDFVRMFQPTPSRLSMAPGMMMADPGKPKPKKRKTKYQAAYQRNFKRIKSKYLKKNGQWKQGGFKAAVKEAHRLTRKQS